MGAIGFEGRCAGNGADELRPHIVAGDVPSIRKKGPSPMRQPRRERRSRTVTGNARSDFGRRFRTCHAQSPRTLLRAADRDVVDPLWVFRKARRRQTARAHLPTLTISKIPSGVPSRQTNSRLDEHSVGNVVNEFLTLKGSGWCWEFN
jgi:hypothetical protein